MIIKGKMLGAKNVDINTRVLVDLDEDVLHKINKLYNGKELDVEVRIDDNRSITVKQRSMIFATIKDISLFTGDDPEYLKEFLKFDYCGESGEKYFSLSDCSMDTAREFINHLIEFILRENIPLSDLAINRTDDIDKYLYYCLKFRRCSITGKANADLHHCEGYRVGMGGDRKKVNHSGRELIALSREWHSRVHQEGEEEIFKAYKIYGITIDDAALKRLGLNVEDIS